ncbi:MAG TPA: hypothetical protein VF475_05035 [Sphingobium sp.]
MIHLPASPALRSALAIILAAPLWLAACRQAGDPENDATPANVMATREGRSAEIAANAVAALSTAPANIAIAPTDAAAVEARTALTPEAAKGEKGARAVLLDWARALETGDWEKARAQWGHGGEDSGLDAEAFAAPYRKYRQITVSVGDGTVEGGAGSLYYEVPVTLAGVLRDGRTERLTGTVVVRRVNDVDGATAEQLRWHLSQADLKPRP